jgi:hypothetical protein
MIVFLDDRLINTYLIYPQPLYFVSVVATVSKPVQACSECFEEIVEILSHEKRLVVYQHLLDRMWWTPGVRQSPIFGCLAGLKVDMLEIALDQAVSLGDDADEADRL